MGSQVIQLRPGLTGIADDEPKEGRKVISFQPLVFATGLEIYEFNSQQLGNQPLSSVQSCYIDAQDVSSTVAGAQSLIVTVGSPQNSNQFAGGRQILLSIPGNATNPAPNIGPNPLQGFFLLPAAMPFDIKVSCSINLVGTVNLFLYNFNVFFLGQKYAKDLMKSLQKNSHINAGK